AHPPGRAEHDARGPGAGRSDRLEPRPRGRHQRRGRTRLPRAVDPAAVRRREPAAPRGASRAPAGLGGRPGPRPVPSQLGALASNARRPHRPVRQVARGGAPVKISIFGLGYVGAVSLACLARDRHEVIGVDVDPWKLDLIRNGRTPIIEAGMDTLMAAAIASGRVQVTDDVAGAVGGTELSFLCVGTPSRPNGSQDLRALERLAAQLGDTL